MTDSGVSLRRSAKKLCSVPYAGGNKGDSGERQSLHPVCFHKYIADFLTKGCFHKDESRNGFL